MMSTFRALVLDQTADGFTTAVQTLDEAQLPDGDVTVAVEYSSLNYKDGMVLGGNIGRLVRNFPHVPGIDLAGTVAASDSEAWTVGDRVVLTGFRVGEARWGGFAERARVSSAHLVALPESVSTRQSMAIGTAGLTAMLAINALEHAGLTPSAGPVLVTGATGGVGQTAVHLLARLGYSVTASTGKPADADRLRELGASDVIDRNEIADAPAKPMLAERWAGCVDAVGGATLAHVLTELKYGAAVAACGNTAGNDLPTNVIPFLLRGVNLLGIDSVMASLAARNAAWARIGEIADLAAIEAATVDCSLDELPAHAARILQGGVSGRVVVNTAA